MAVESTDEQQPFVVADQGRSPYKVIMAGIKGVGKSTLLAMLDSKVDVGFGEEILFSIKRGESSRGRTKLMLETKCQDKILSVWVWDTADMEKHSGSIGMTKSYFEGVHGAIMVYERGRDETKTGLLEWAKRIHMESPDCVFSLWCNNRNQEFGTGDATRDMLGDMARHYKIKPQLMFTYGLGDTEQVHNYFNTLMCEIYAKVPNNLQRDSIKVEKDKEKEQKRQKGKCPC